MDSAVLEIDYIFRIDGERAVASLEMEVWPGRVAARAANCNRVAGVEGGSGDNGD